MAQVKKLSVATVFGKIKLSELMAAKDKTLPVMRVFGIATGTKSGTTNFGDYTALQGQFRAVHPVTGETHDAATLFLPDIALLPITAALASGAQGVEFAIVVSAVYVAEKEGFKAGGSPYEYTFENLLPMGGDDPLARLQGKLQALAAPAADPASAPAPAADPASAPAEPTKPAGKGKAGK